MTTGFVCGVGDVTGDFSHGMYRTKKHELRTRLQSGTGPLRLIVTPIQSNRSRELFGLFVWLAYIHKYKTVCLDFVQKH